MAYDTSGIYTRVDNSFSNPVVGATISPTHADTYFDDIDAALNAYRGTSTTSLAIAIASKTFTTQAGKLFVVGNFVLATSDADTTNYMHGQVTAYSGTSMTVNVTTIGGSGTLADWTIRLAGPKGGTGATGATGATSGIKQAYSSTTADADPGAGIFRLNNATPASATAAYLDNVDAGGATVSGLWDLIDDSTTTTKGTLRFEKSTDPTVWAQFSVTGSVVDGTGYRKVTLTAGAGSGAFTNTDTFAITFIRSGDKGADGAGTGDVSAAAAFAVDNVVVRSDGTAKGVQASGISIDDSNNVSGIAALSSTTIELGHASDTTLSRSAAGIVAVEGVPLYSQIPQNSQSAAYTTVLADAQKHILHPTADNNPRTFTIDSNANVAYPIGTVLTFINQINTVTIAITSDTMKLAGPGTTGSRTLSANGIATAVKVASTEWIISGAGLT